MASTEKTVVVKKCPRVVPSPYRTEAAEKPRMPTVLCLYPAELEAFAQAHQRGFLKEHQFGNVIASRQIFTPGDYVEKLIARINGQSTSRAFFDITAYNLEWIFIFVVDDQQQIGVAREQLLSRGLIAGHSVIAVNPGNNEWYEIEE